MTTPQKLLALGLFSFGSFLSCAVAEADEDPLLNRITVQGGFSGFNGVTADIIAQCSLVNMTSASFTDADEQAILACIEQRRSMDPQGIDAGDQWDLLEVPNLPPLLMMQGVKDHTIKLFVLPHDAICADQCELSVYPSDIETLGLTNENVAAFVTLTIESNPRKATYNARCPVVVNKQTGQAKQIL